MMIESVMALSPACLASTSASDDDDDGDTSRIVSVQLCSNYQNEVVGGATLDLHGRGCVQHPSNLHAGFGVSRVFVAFALPSILPGTTGSARCTGPCEEIGWIHFGSIFRTAGREFRSLEWENH